MPKQKEGEEEKGELETREPVSGVIRKRESKKKGG
jgi:hypothetical protein